MTYVANDDEEGLVPKLKLRIEDPKGDYVILGGSEEGFDGGGGALPPSPRIISTGSIWWSICWWAKLVLFLSFVGVLAVVFFKWVGPFFINKTILPIINWETATFSRPVLAVLLFASSALFPALLLPSSPSWWVGGMTFGYGFGFLIIFAGVAIGISLPYFIGSLFHPKIQGWIERYPKRASVIRLAGEGTWFNQFQAVMLIRISPFPYIVYNYCAVATDVKFGPYLLGSLTGMVPDIFTAIYTGIVIRTLADASEDHHSLSVQQIIFNVLGFCIMVATTVLVTVYAKRRLSDLQKDEELLLQ